MEIVINKCHGGFGLSAKAVARLAELQGKRAYFFTPDRTIGKMFDSPPIPITVEQADDKETAVLGMFYAFDIPTPPSHDEWGKHAIETGRQLDRSDPLLVQVVRELGGAANGRYAELEIVEIPDGVSWELDEYDGVETIHEVHRSWG